MKKQPYWNQRVRNESGPAGTLTNQRGLKGSKLGPANDGRKLSGEEKRAVIEKMRKEGKI